MCCTLVYIPIVIKTFNIFWFQELSRELQATRRNMKDASGSDGMSQSSRASSSSSLNNIDSAHSKPKQEEIAEKPHVSLFLYVQLVSF